MSLSNQLAKSPGNNQPLDIEALFYTTGTEISVFTLNRAHELEGWQRWLWQEVFHEDFELMQEIDAEFWQQLEQEATRKQALKRLPQQLVVFTLLDLPPIQLQFCAVWDNILMSSFCTTTLRRNTGQIVSIRSGKAL